MLLTTPAVTRAITETTASVENRGTTFVATDQRSPPALTSRRARNARPPTQTPAASTCTESLRTASAPSTRAWPERAGVTAIAAASKTSAEITSASERRCSEHGHDGESEPSTARETHTCPKPVSSTSRASGHLSTASSPNPAAFTPVRAIQGEGADRQQPSGASDDGPQPRCPSFPRVRDEDEDRHAADAEKDQSQPDEPRRSQRPVDGRRPASASSTWSATPLPSPTGRPTENTNAPRIGCESADSTRHATV